MTTLMAGKRICERCDRPYPYVRTEMSQVELIEKYRNEEVVIDYTYARDVRYSEVYTGQKSEPSSNQKNCAECILTLLQEQVLIQIKRERDFRKIPNMQKAYMIIGQQLPSDICFFCGVKIDAGPRHSPSNIYICKQCKKEGLTINDVNKGIELEWICICKHRNNPDTKICSKCGWHRPK